MWSIGKVKEVGRLRFKANYWKTVFVSSILTGTVGGVGYIGSQFSSNFGGERSDALPQTLNELESDPEKLLLFIGIVLLGVFVGMLVGLAIGMVIDAFIFNPLTVGINRFAYRNIHEDAKVRETMFAYDHSYKNIVRVMFSREIRIFLWGLLFIIPGIYKSYEYRLVPYLLNENPDMDKEFALAESKRMMDGNKGKAFLLDLSFIGWDILSILTLGILAVFYVAPYKAMSQAVMYDAVKYDKVIAQNNN